MRQFLSDADDYTPDFQSRIIHLFGDIVWVLSCIHDFFLIDFSYLCFSTIIIEAHSRKQNIIHLKIPVSDIYEVYFGFILKFLHFLMII